MTSLEEVNATLANIGSRVWPLDLGSAPGVYAMGDVKGEPAFTHVAYNDYYILRTNLLEGGNATTRSRVVPNTTFIDP